MSHSFWQTLKVWWKQILLSSMQLDVKSVLFGIVNDNNDDMLHFMNYCILYGKWYINSCKSSNSDIFFIQFVKLIKDKLMLEKNLSEMRKDGNFEQYMSKYYNIF